MFNHQKEEIDWGGRPLTIETGKIARQADGAVIVTYGETKVLTTVVAAKSPKPGTDFFPLTVNYQEKAYAAGKIPGGFFKREGRPSENETLVSRLIDRPIRPLFADGFYCETQVIATVLSHDLDNNPDIVSMIGASAALALSGVPFNGPIGGARVGYKNNEYVLNPTVDDMENMELDLVVAGTNDAVLMVESEASELSEEIMLGAVMFGHKNFQPVLAMINSLAQKAAKDPREHTVVENSELHSKIKDIAFDDLSKAYQIQDKSERRDAIDKAKEKVEAAFTDEMSAPDAPETLAQDIGNSFKKLEANIVRGRILNEKIRIDGRDLSSVRAIDSEVGILPRAHGSALFTRGETQALVVTTLGTGDDEQFVDSLTGTTRERFMLHYNFPPYSVGEAGRMGTPGRREIGHGKLAWRAVNPMLPLHHDFPYTLRVVSEITESNGSSSMATVCGTSLALMDAGVPLKRPIAGIAMGLIKEGDQFAVLSDILGDEDHLGDMDFKVAGSDQGITSLQMDIKIDGITEEIMKVALEQAKAGRIHILGEMAKALTEARDELGEHAPRIETIKIPSDKIREVIGTGGKVIREITEKTGAKIDIADDGTIKIASSDGKSITSAINWIKSITAEPEIGVIYQGTVVKTTDFGAFVNFCGARDGLVHISQLAQERVENTTDIVKQGDKVWVKMVGFDRGKIKLTMKSVDQTTGKEIERSSQVD